MRTRPLHLLIWITTKTPRAGSIHYLPLGEISHVDISLWIPNIQYLMWKNSRSQDLSTSHGWMESSDLIDSNKGSIIQLIPIKIERGRIVWLPVLLWYLVLWVRLMDVMLFGWSSSLIWFYIKALFWFIYIYQYSVLIFFQYLNVQKLLEAVYECKVNSIYWYFQLKK